MRQGTTPTLVIHTSGLELEKLTSLYLTIEQNGTTLTKRMEDLEIEENTVAVTLTQEETLQFMPGRYHRMMIDEFGINLAEENESLGFDFKEQYVAGTSDYNKLKNKPTLNGKEIIGAMEEVDPTVSGWAKEPTKPSYTAEEVGAIKNDEIKAISLDELNSLWEGV